MLNKVLTIQTSTFPIYWCGSPTISGFMKWLLSFKITSGGKGSVLWASWFTSQWRVHVSKESKILFRLNYSGHSKARLWEFKHLCKSTSCIDSDNDGSVNGLNCVPPKFTWYQIYNLPKTRSCGSRVGPSSYVTDSQIKMGKSEHRNTQTHGEAHVKMKAGLYPIYW